MYIDKQTYFENQRRQKNVYLEINLNHVFPALLFYLALIWTLCLLLMFLPYYLNQSFL